MGIYNTFGSLEVQLKIMEGESDLKEIGDEVNEPDGIYVGYEGCVVIQGGKFIAEFSCLYDKWGGEINAQKLLDDENPLSQAIKLYDSNSNK